MTGRPTAGVAIVLLAAAPIVLATFRPAFDVGDLQASAVAEERVPSIDDSTASAGAGAGSERSPAPGRGSAAGSALDGAQASPSSASQQAAGPLALTASPRDAAGERAAPIATAEPGARVRVRLDPPVLEPGAASARLTGRDPDAPRGLVLWRRGPEGPHPLAHARSRPGGRFDFGQWPLPVTGIELAVGAEGGPPAASEFERWSAPPPAPRADLYVDAQGLRLRVVPVTSAGVALVHEAGTGRLLGRGSLAPDALGEVTPLRLRTLDDPGATLEVVQVLPDGRRSPPKRLELSDAPAF